jgi:hypothetical protein
VVFGIRFDELSWVSTDASRRPTECTEDFSVVYKEVEIYFVQALFRYMFAAHVGRYMLYRYTPSEKIGQPAVSYSVSK